MLKLPNFSKICRKSFSVSIFITDKQQLSFSTGRHRPQMPAFLLLPSQLVVTQVSCPSIHLGTHFSVLPKSKLLFLCSMFFFGHCVILQQHSLQDFSGTDARRDTLWVLSENIYMLPSDITVNLAEHRIELKITFLKQNLEDLTSQHPIPPLRFSIFCMRHEFFSLSLMFWTLLNDVSWWGFSFIDHARHSRSFLPEVSDLSSLIHLGLEFLG